MTVLDRLIGDEEPKIPAHSFFAAMVLYKKGHFTKAQLEGKFQANDHWGPMSVAETDDLAEFFSGLDGSLTLDEIHSAIMLGEVGELTKAQIKTVLGLTAG